METCEDCFYFKTENRVVFKYFGEPMEKVTIGGFCFALPHIEDRSENQMACRYFTPKEEK